MRVWCAVRDSCGTDFLWRPKLERSYGVFESSKAYSSWKLDSVNESLVVLFDYMCAKKKTKNWPDIGLLEGHVGLG